MKFLLKIGLGTNDLNLIIQHCAKVFFFNICFGKLFEIVFVTHFVTFIT